MNKRLTDKEIISLCHDVQIGTGGMDYADALTAIAKELTLRKGEETPQEAWIPVEQELPEILEDSRTDHWEWSGPVKLVYISASGNRRQCYGSRAVDIRDKTWKFIAEEGMAVNATHWQPLTWPVAPPLPYQEEKENGR